MRVLTGSSTIIFTVYGLVILPFSEVTSIRKVFVPVTRFTSLLVSVINEPSNFTVDRAESFVQLMVVEVTVLLTEAPYVKTPFWNEGESEMGEWPKTWCGL